MSDLGNRLHAARQKKALTVAEVAIETRIRGKIIEALEAGDYRQLPPPPFDRGLLKNYALFLGLEPDIVLEEYGIEVGLAPAPVPPPEVKPPPKIEAAPPTPLETPSIFVAPAEPTKRLPPGYREPYDSKRDVPRPDVSTLSLDRNADGAVGASTSGEAMVGSTFGESARPREASPFFAGRPEPVFEVASEIPSEPTPAPDRPIWTQRLSATKLPEAIAAAAVAVAIFGLVAFGYTRLFVSDNRVAQPVSGAPSEIQTAPPRQTTIPLPTSVPTFAATLPGGIQATPRATKIAKGAPASPNSRVPPNAQMVVQISASASPVWAWVVADNVEVFKGNIENDTKAFNAHERLYIQVKDLPNGSVIFDGKAVLARVFAERKIIERAWQLNSAGIAVAVEPHPFLPTVAATATQTSSRTPTLTLTPANSPTPNTPATPTPTPSETNTPTAALGPTAPFAEAARTMVRTSYQITRFEC
jgi:hypothetical protein